MVGKCRVFRFSDVEVREDELRATHNGEPLSIEPKAFRVLLYLLQHAGHLVSKSELMNAVWGDTAVTENSLTRAVAVLRRVLQDDPHQPHFIETVSTAGYRFICPVDGEGKASEAPIDFVSEASHNETSQATCAVVPISPKSRSARRRLVMTGSSAVLLALLTVTIWYRRHPLPAPHIIDYIQLTHAPGIKEVAAVDVNRLYVNLSTFPETVLQMPIDGGELVPISIQLPEDERPIPGMSAGDFPNAYDLSPDGSSLLCSGPTYSLWSLTVTGNPIRHLATAEGAAWSPDGGSIVYTWRGISS